LNIQSLAPIFSVRTSIFTFAKEASLTTPLSHVSSLFRNISISIWHTFACVLPLWMRIGLFCLLSSSLLILLFDLSALVAPVTKMLIYFKLFFIKTIPGWIELAYTSTKKGLAKIAIVLGGWEAWSLKKTVRHSVRFFATFAARTLLLTFLINLFFGHERKGLKSVPRFLLLKLKNTRVGEVIFWWSRASDRSKRIITGLILCLILISAGHAFIGISILVFDVVWEFLIILWRVTVRAWRWTYPLVMRIIPNAIGSFVTNKLLPLITTAVPVVRDDHRVIFVRYNFRERYREYKKRLLKFSRAKRPTIRATITPLVSDRIRKNKSDFLKNVTNYTKESEHHSS